MIIPIKAPDGEGGGPSMDKVEWVMLELNGELVKPQQIESDKRRVEFGSVQFDDAVSLPHLCMLNSALLSVYFSYITHNIHKTL
jgi:hypothetical protein